MARPETKTVNLAGFPGFHLVIVWLGVPRDGQNVKAPGELYTRHSEVTVAVVVGFARTGDGHDHRQGAHELKKKSVASLFL